MPTSVRPATVRLALILLSVAALPSCAALQSAAALSQVRFSLDRVHRMELAGVDVDRLRSYDDLAFTDVLRIASAASQGTMPISFTLELAGENPEGNPEARMLALDWTLFLRDRETVSGVLEQEVRFPPGIATGFPVTVSLDLREFFEEQGRDIVELALNLAGLDGEPVGVALEIVPTVETPLGPIRYPRPIRLGGGE